MLCTGGRTRFFEKGAKIYKPSWKFLFKRLTDGLANTSISFADAFISVGNAGYVKGYPLRCINKS